VHGGLSGVGTNNTGGVLEDVRGDRLAIDGVFSDAFLVTAHLRGTSNTDMGVRVSWTYQVEDLEGPFIDFASAIRNDANDDFLPAVCAPRFRSVAAAEVSDVLENPAVRYQYWFVFASGAGNARVHRSAEQDLVFIIHSHHNEEFCMPAIEVRSKAVLGTHEIIGVASCSGVAHLGHFLDTVHTLGNNMGGDLDVENKVAVLEFNMPDRPALHELFPGHGVAGAHGSRSEI